MLRIDNQDDAIIAALVECLITHPEDGDWLKEELARCGGKAVPHLIKVLANKNPSVVRDAALTLGYIGPPAAAALPALKPLLVVKPVHVPALSDPRRQSDDIAPSGHPTLPGGPVVNASPFGLLVRSEPTKPADVAAAAAEAIVHIDPRVPGAVPVLIAALEKLDYRMVSASPVTNREERRAHKDTGGLYFSGSMFGHTEISEAARVLARAGVGAKGAVPVIAQRLKAAEDDQFDSWANAAGSLGPLAADIAPILMDNLKNPKRFASSAEALAKLGSAGEQAVPVLLEKLKDETTAVEAARSLGKFGSGATPAVPILAALLHSGDDQLASAAAGALGEIGPPAYVAVPELLTAIEHGPRDTPVEAADALGFLKSPSALPGLTALLAHPDDSRANAAALALARFGPAAERAVAPLTINLKSPARQSNAIYALGAIGPAAAPAVPELVRATAELNDLDLCLAIEALGKIGPAAKAALPELEKHLQSADRGVVDESVAAFWKIDAARARVLKLKEPKPEDKEV